MRLLQGYIWNYWVILFEKCLFIYVENRERDRYLIDFYDNKTYFVEGENIINIVVFGTHLNKRLFCRI